MKKKLQKWTEETSAELREISADAARIAGKLYKKAKNSISAPKPLTGPTPVSRQPEKQSILRRQTNQAHPEVQSPDAEQRELTRELERAVHGAYYQEGGIRFYGSCLEQYVRVVLTQETELPQMWAAGYNACIHPMLQQLERLEKKMRAICSDYQQDPLPLNNGALLQTMRQFCTRAREDRLHLEQGWEPEAYRRTLRQYGQDLNERLLIPFCRPDES